MLSKELLTSYYIDNALSIKEIANKHGISTSSVYDAFRKYNIQFKKSKKFQIPKDVLFQEYIEKGRTIKSLVEEFGASTKIIISLLNKYHIKIRIGKATRKAILNKQSLYNLYVTKDLNISQVAKHIGVSERYVSDSLKRFGVKRKRKEKVFYKDLNLTNRTFGRLTVLENFENNCTCECSCGKTILVKKRSLIDENCAIKSCGCARASNYKWIIPPYIIGGIKSKALRRGIDFSLSNSYLEKLYLHQNKKCALSGCDMKFSRSREKLFTTASLDRKDSKRGYVEDNVQWVHKKVNVMKHVLSNDDLIKWCVMIAEFNK